MSQFLITYFVQPQFPTAEEGKVHMGRWMD